MNFNVHSRLEGQHAFLSASKYHWINYDEEKLIHTFTKYQAAQRGTELHDLAKQLIKLGVKLPKNNKTFNAYVNDAIGFKMIPEQVLYYSDNCFGTTDTISFKAKLLRIHDLKNGDTPANMKQLKVYTSLFCLEYGVKPTEIDIELRLYQLDEVKVEQPVPDEILSIMSKIVDYDKLIERLKIGG